MLDYDAGELLVQFEYRGQPLSVKASINGYAAVRLKEHPYSPRSRTILAKHQAKAMDIASVAIYPIHRD